MSISLIISTFEYFFLLYKRKLHLQYAWDIVKLKTINIPFFAYDSFFKGILFLNLVFAIILFFSFSPLVLFILFIIQWLLLVRFGMPFNGGADYLTMLSLFCLFIYRFFINDQLIAISAILYLALQVILSYTIAGLKKLKNPLWYKGFAIRELSQNNSFIFPNRIREFFSIRLVSFFACYAVLIFEIGYLFFLHPTLTDFILISGVLFHLLCFFVFGLNRFFFAWIATYPLLIFFAQFIQNKYF